MKSEINVSGLSIRYREINDADYISLTDIAKYKTQESSLVIGHWMRTRNTIDYLTAWETLYNPNFNPTEIGGFRSDSSLNTFTLSPQKWAEATNAIGIILLVLSNMESLNAEFIKMGMTQFERLIKLNAAGISQMTSLLEKREIQARGSQIADKLLLSTKE